MSLLTIILIIVAAGVLLWAINKFVPMEGNLKTFLNVVVILVLALVILKAAGVFEILSGVRI